MKSKSKKYLSILLAAVIIIGSLGVTNISSAASVPKTHYMKVQKTTNLQYKYNGKWYKGTKLSNSSSYFVATKYKNGDTYAYGYAIKRVKNNGTYRNEKLNVV